MGKGQNLYDMPFEKRVRIKYFSFGVTLGLSSIGILALIDLIGDIIISTFITNQPIIINSHQEYSYCAFAMLIPLSYYLWFSKAKPIKYQHLDETIGLKTDYDRINGGGA